MIHAGPMAFGHNEITRWRPRRRGYYAALLAYFAAVSFYFGPNLWLFGKLTWLSPPTSSRWFASAAPPSSWR